jgi:hypothetical protein
MKNKSQTYIAVIHFMLHGLREETCLYRKARSLEEAEAHFTELIKSSYPGGKIVRIETERTLL